MYIWNTLSWLSTRMHVLSKQAQLTDYTNTCILGTRSADWLHVFVYFVFPPFCGYAHANIIEQQQFWEKGKVRQSLQMVAFMQTVSHTYCGSLRPTMSKNALIPAKKIPFWKKGWKWLRMLPKGVNLTHCWLFKNKNGHFQNLPKFRNLVFGI